VLSSSVRPAGIPSQVKIPDVVVGRPGGSWNSGTALAVSIAVATKVSSGYRSAIDATNRVARVVFRSVFDVGPGGSRLAIGRFSRPLLEEECRYLKKAWEKARLPEVVDFEVSSKQVSFLSPTPQVADTWNSIDRLLAATSSLAEAS
jgi:hypothetical protein